MCVMQLVDSCICREILPTWGMSEQLPMLCRRHNSFISSSTDVLPSPQHAPAVERKCIVAELIDQNGLNVWTLFNLGTRAIEPLPQKALKIKRAFVAPKHAHALKFSIIYILLYRQIPETLKMNWQYSFKNYIIPIQAEHRCTHLQTRLPHFN